MRKTCQTKAEVTKVNTNIPLGRSYGQETDECWKKRLLTLPIQHFPWTRAESETTATEKQQMRSGPDSEPVWASLRLVIDIDLMIGVEKRE